MRFTRQSAFWIPEAIRSAHFPLHPDQRNRIFGRVATLGWVTCVIGLTCAVPGCSPSSGLPTAPSSSKLPPEVTALTPSVGAAGGGSIIKITGTGFMPGMAVTLGGIKLTAQADVPFSGTTYYAETPAHAVGTVDLLVTNPDGGSQRVADAYAYGLEDAFDINGIWVGFTDHGTDTGVQLVIRDNTLVNAVCAYKVVMPFTFPALPRVQNGAFSLIAGDGATLAGRMVSASEMVGTIDFPACNNMRLTWRVHRESSPWWSIGHR